MSRQRLRNLMHHRIVQHLRAAQVPSSLLRLPRRQVARAGCTMLHLAARRQPKALLRPFVGLLLGHGNTDLLGPIPGHCGIAESLAV